MKSTRVLDLVSAIAKSEGHRIESVGEDTIEFAVPAPYGEERILAFLPGFISDGMPLIEFRAATATISAQNRGIVSSLAWSLTERNRVTVDAGWAWNLDPSGGHTAIVSARIEGRRFSQHKFRSVITELVYECSYFNKQFISKSGHLVIFPVEVVLNPKKADNSQRPAPDEDNPVLIPLEHPPYLHFVWGGAELSALHVDATEDGCVCISFVSHGLPVRVFVTVLERGSTAEPVLRFSSLGKQLPEGATAIQDTADLLLLRNASTLHAYWSTEFDNGNFFAVITRNTLANELDYAALHAILGSFVQEYHFAAAELGGFS